jgi:hypothetical protein
MKIGESLREVRITWLGFTGIFTLFGSISLWREGAAWPYLYGVAVFFALFAAVAPMALLPLYRIWAKFAAFMAWFNTHLLLGIVYYLVITPIGLGMRALGKDPLDRTIDKSATSYWRAKTHHRDRERYEKQY